MSERRDIQETTYLIQDLCCATEEQIIRKQVQHLPGIETLDFNLVTHRLKVRHSCQEKSIARRLQEIGMPGTRETGSAHPGNGYPVRLLVSTSVSGLLFIVGVAGQLAGLSPFFAMVLYLGSLLAGGWHIAIKAYRALRTATLEMNTLMTVASVGAVLLGQYAEGAAVMLLYSFSLLLESMSAERSRNAIRSLMSLSPTKATVLHNGVESEVPLEDVRVDDTVLIRPGERIPIDGIVLRGDSSVDESAVTGEPFPSVKVSGHHLYAGSLNQLGALEVRVIKPAADSTIAKIIHLVEDAQSRKAASQTAVERFARYYTPAVFIAAVAIALVPPLLFHGTFHEWFYRSLVLLVIACPCALVISTPVVLASAIAYAARRGILIKGGRYLELLSHVRAVAFDKTGTMTSGRATVTDVIPLDSRDRKEILRIAAAAEMHSEHHLAGALLRQAREEGISLSELPLEGFTSITGRGIRTHLAGMEYVIGNHLFMEELGVCSPTVERHLAQLESEGKTVVILADREKVVGLIGVTDVLREEGKRTVASLRRLGIEKIVLLTGDNQKTADIAGRELAVDEVQAGLLPDEKLRFIDQLRERFGTVAMVGDGINDAPALAAADVGIVMGGAGSDVAMDTGAIVLMSDNIDRVPEGIALGRRSLRIIRQNIALALGTKAVFLALGVLGMTSLWLAILADDGAALLVILNALRLLRTRTHSE